MRVLACKGERMGGPKELLRLSDALTGARTDAAGEKAYLLERRRDCPFSVRNKNPI